MLSTLAQIENAIANETVISCLYNGKVRTGKVIDGGITRTGKNIGQLYAKLEISNDGPVKCRTINPIMAEWIVSQ